MLNQVLFFLSGIFFLFLGQFFSIKIILVLFGILFLFYFFLKFFLKIDKIFGIDFKIFKNIFLFSLFGIFLGILRIFIFSTDFSENHISNFLDLNQKIYIEGRVCGEVDKRIFKTNLEFCTEKIFLGKKELGKKFKKKLKNFSGVQKNFFSGKKISTQGKILISTSLYPEYNFGDHLRIFGKLKTPFENKDFSYKNFLLMNKIFGVVYYGRISSCHSSEGGNPVCGNGNNNFYSNYLDPNQDLPTSFGFNNLNKNYYFFENFLKKEKFLFYKKIFEYKKNFLEKIENIYPSPHSAFLAGLLIGDRKGLPSEIKTDFQKNGLAHIVAISGYNITIIIILISGIFFFLPRKIGIILSSIFIVLFTIFVGGSSAVVRASVMGILGLLALYYGREKNVLILILTAVFLMSFWNPAMLWRDVGFHLSVLAIFGVVYLVKIFEKFTKKFQNFLGIKEVILLTISASLMTFPIISYQFGIISLISPIANLFIDPLIPLAMLFGFLSIVFSFFSQFGIFYSFQEFFGFLTYSVLDLSLKISHYLANLKFSYFEYQISIFFVIFYFLVLGFIFWVFRKDFE